MNTAQLCRLFLLPGGEKGASAEICGELAPSSRCRDLLPGGEKATRVKPLPGPKRSQATAIYAFAPG